jgi:hypothetical protein
VESSAAAAVVNTGGGSRERNKKDIRNKREGIESMSPKVYYHANKKTA